MKKNCFKHIKIIPFLLTFMFSATLSIAQLQGTEFGKNRVQYRLFNWRYYSTPHFEIYYYDRGQNLAKNLTELLEEQHESITDILGYSPYAKTKVFLYNNNIELNQSNVGLNEAKFDIAGQTNFLKNQIEIAFQGSYKDFEKDIKFEITKNYIEDMLFGGLISEVFASSYLFTVPEWFTEGIAAYVAYGWDENMDDFVRQFLQEEKLKNILKLQGYQAQLAGQSIWNFISEKYGRVNISSILNLTRIIRSEEKSITNSLGIPYSQFLDEYKNFYLSNALENTESLPEKDQKIARTIKNNWNYKTEISPNGKWVAYSLNKDGRFKVKLKDIETGKEHVILRGGVRRMDGNSYGYAPVMNWGDSATLGIVDYERGVNLLKLYNPYSKSWTRRDLRKYEQINYLDIYENGKTAVISVTTKGQSDLYLIGINKPNNRRITNDKYDDLYPTFVSGTKKIIFSSNRTKDSIDQNIEYNNLKPSYNLFQYTIGGNNDDFIQLTNDLGQNIMPISLDSNSVFYLSNKSGINNIYELSLNNRVSKQFTAYATGIHNYSISNDPRYLSLVAFDKGKKNIYLTTYNSNYQEKFLMSTFRKQIELSRRIYINKKDDKSLNTNKTSISAISDSVSIVNKGLDGSIEEPTEKLDADDFDFESVLLNGRSQESSLLKNLGKLRKSSSILGPLKYEPAFEIDNVGISFLFHPLFGFSPFIEYQMNDLLENNKFSGGITSSVFNQVSGNATKFYGEYQYLPLLIDYSIRFDRKSYTFRLNEGIDEQKYAYNKLNIGASYPLSTTTRITANSFLGNRSFVETGNAVFSSGSTSALAKAPIQNEILYGASINFVYENSEVLGYNIRQGTRGKLSLENYNFSNSFEQSFYKLSIDVRHYQKIYKEITFATKLYAGSFFGNNAPYFLLGGLDNWATLNRSANINNTSQSESSLNRNPLTLTSTESPFENKNILFHDIVTGLRGFRINELSGRKTILLSSELRIPLFRALSSNAIKSAFIRNFQIVGFYDIGTAWRGGNPWDKNNSINTEVVQTNIFKAVINNYKNPWLSSTGVGISTVLFGYYGTLYYVVPIEDYKFNDPTILLGLGYNF